MVILDYCSLDLQIAKESEGSYNQYSASILENGDIKASRNFELRSDLKLTQMLDLIEEKAVISRPQPEEITHIELGKMLYNAVFSGELEEYFNKRFNEAQEENYGLRVSLQFSEDVPEIAALPWEYLHNGEDFLITRRSILLSRLPAEIKKIKFLPLDSILRMLVVISSPDDPSISLLNTEKEQEIILEAVDKLVRDQKIKVDFTDDATFENVQGYLNEENYHIVHFTGHGKSSDGKGYLLFETEDGKPRPIDNKTLADLFSDLGIRLVMLSSCESAKGSNKEAFGDLASMLSKRGVPAVVAMQYSVLDDVAINFAYIFYRTIASGKSVDLALTEARIAMKNSEKSNGFDFATPVLYLSDCNCVQVGKIKPEPAEFEFKLTKLSDLQVMNRNFVARKNELRALERGFKSDVNRAAIIHGFGGLGKTVLATRLALKMSEYFDGVFGMRCTSTTRPEEILNKINDFLMMKRISNLNQILNQQVPLEVKTTLLVNILNQVRFLIILDNFEDCLDEDRKDIENPELKAFVQHLLNNTISNTKFLITTRYDFDLLGGRLPESIEHISLPELHFSQTNWLMNNYKELANLSIRKKRQIYDVIGGHPWIIGQFAKLASIQGVDSLMLDLEPLEKKFFEYTLWKKSFSKLDATAKKLLLFASIYEEAVPIEALSWIVGDDAGASPSIVEPLQKLIQWGLISNESEFNQTVYTEHTIIRDFAQGKLKEELKKKLLIRAARYYENLFTQSRNIWDYLKARDYYFQAEEWESAHEIVENTSNQLIRWGYIELAMNLLNESINTTSEDTKTNAEYTLATIYHSLGDLNTALKILNKIKYKHEETKNKEGVANMLHAIGLIHQEQGNYEEAANMYNQSRKIYECLEDIRGVIVIFFQFGEMFQERGNYEEAVKIYNYIRNIGERIDYKEGIAATLNELGTIYLLQGNCEEAMKTYNQSLKISEEIKDKRGIAIALHQFGNIHCLQGNYEEAVNMYNQALKLKTELGDKKGITTSLHQLGLIHQRQDNYNEAIKMYTHSLKMKEELRDKRGIALTMHQIGNVHYLQGNYKEAVKLYNQSLKIAEELGNRSGIAQTLYQLGMIHEEKEEYAFALRDYLKAFSIFKKLNSPYSQSTSKLISNLKDKMGEEEFNTVFEKMVKQNDF